MTRLKLGSPRFLARFLSVSRKWVEQAAMDPDCLEGMTAFGPGLVFWTVTLWKDEESVRNYARTGAHRDTQHWLTKWCSEGVTGYFVSEKTAALPDKHELPAKIREVARFFPIQSPTRAHLDRHVPNERPWLTRSFKRSVAPVSRLSRELA